MPFLPRCLHALQEEVDCQAATIQPEASWCSVIADNPAVDYAGTHMPAIMQEPWKHNSC